MTNKFIFHEKCNKDVSNIIYLLRLNASRSIAAFQEHLTEAYQLIYENPNCGEKFTFSFSETFFDRYDVRRLYVQRFLCWIIFARLPHNNVIVLGVFLEHRSVNSRLF